MTSNIKELYKLAGVNKTNVTCDYCELKCYDCTKTPCPVDYPPFTAEKQLELIKWVTRVNEELYLEIGKNTYDYYSFYFGYLKWTDTFEQGLCGLILQLWDELSSEQRTEVRGILQ
jgi:hypothetical protein